jgi:hypothetical protein
MSKGYVTIGGQGYRLDQFKADGSIPDLTPERVWARVRRYRDDHHKWVDIRFPSDKHLMTVCELMWVMCRLGIVDLENMLP